MKKSSIVCALSIVFTSCFVSTIPPRYNPELNRRFIARCYFDDYADFSFDASKDSRFNPYAIKAGSIICIRGRDIPLFFQKYHPKIRSHYIIITQGEHRDAFQESYLPYLEDKKIIAWFGVHPPAFNHPKFTSLPLGVKIKTQNPQQKQKIQHLFELYRKKHKKNLIYLNFAQNHPERRRVKQLFLHDPLCFVSSRIDSKQRVSFRQYLAEMATCIFTFSPPGNANDSYRTWESILVGSIPLVLHSELDELHADLPIIVVDDWHEVTPEFLEKNYQELAEKEFNFEKLYMGYWIQKIESVKKNYLKTMRMKYAVCKR